MRGMVFGNIQRDQLGAAQDAGDDVVEFVRDAGGELVEGEKFLFEHALPGIAGFCGFRRKIFFVGQERADFDLQISGGSGGGMGGGWFHSEADRAGVSAIFPAGAIKKSTGDLSRKQSVR